MRNTFLELEKGLMRSCDFCFIGIEYCSADYLLGVQKAADVLRALSFRYANADGTSFPLKVYNPDGGYILEGIKACDAGNIHATSMEELGKKLSSLSIPTGSIPIFIGADHSVTYELVKNVAKDDIVVVQFDAHSDFIDEFKSYPHGSVMKETSKLEKVSRVVHFGIRGNLNSGPAINDSKKEGNMVVPYHMIAQEYESLLEYLRGKNVYITFDVDFLNPAIAPATNCPEPGGPSYSETLKYLEDVINSCNRVIGMDFVEFNPDCEGVNLTGVTVVNLIMQSMSYITHNVTRKT